MTYLFINSYGYLFSENRQMVHSYPKALMCKTEVTASACQQGGSIFNAVVYAKSMHEPSTFRK